MNNFLWKPDNQRVQNSILSDFSKYINIDSEKDFKKIWNWSVSKFFGQNFGIIQK